jgi:diguanylate cyclase (GGDEF)-like protein
MASSTVRAVLRDIAIDDTLPLRLENQALREEIARLRILNDELERVVVRDTLTPLFNRRHFINCLTERLGRLQRYGTQTALVFIDVDGLKGINDRHGHGAGDAALNHVARIIAQDVRSTDVAARIGGDEFALLFDGMDDTAAHAKATRLVRLIASEPCDFHGFSLPITASFGCTVLQLGDNDFAAIARADTAMYAAKKQARV